MTDVEKKPKVGRPKKEEAFIKERENIVNTINTLLGIDGSNKIFFVEDIEEKGTDNEIRELIPAIKKYYYCTNWRCFSSDRNRVWLALVKTIYKKSNYKLSTVYLFASGTKVIDKHGVMVTK